MKKNISPKLRTSRRSQRPHAIIHACDPGPGMYPAHTHGLTKRGSPEYIMDPLATDKKSIAGIMEGVYVYLSKPENMGRFQELLSGNTIKLTQRDIYPDATVYYPHVYCLREVTPEFEAVKMAYQEWEMKEGMRFMQIYFEGDDFALTDEYYREGMNPECAAVSDREPMKRTTPEGGVPMNEQNQKHSTVVDQIRQCLKDANLTVEREDTNPALPGLIAHYSDQVIVQISYVPEVLWVFLEAYFLKQVPEDRVRNVIVLLNHFNSHLPFHHFSLDRSGMRVIVRTGIVLASSSLNTDQFESYLQGLLQLVGAYEPLIYEQIMSDKDPDEQFASFVSMNKHLWDADKNGMKSES